jgi:alkylation response protein AidB-like acyl-CoA dehydrogenase
VLGATALRDDADRLASIAAGTLRVAVATTGEVVASGTPAHATGRARGVLDAAGADTIVLAATDDAGGAVVLRATRGDGLTITPEASIDGTRSTSTIELENVPVDVIASGDAAVALLEDVSTVGSVALAAELAGAASRCLQLSVDYAKTRVQFGHPIGSYQAIKHKCVDVLISVEAARTAVRYASRLADAGDPDRQLVASVARVQANSALVRAAACAMQVHGGAGFTWDNDAHLYLKRGKASERLLGEPWRHQQSIAQALGI